jgi:hypothetical protein
MNDEELAFMFDVLVVSGVMGIHVIIVLVRHTVINFRLNE